MLCFVGKRIWHRKTYSLKCPNRCRWSLCGQCPPTHCHNFAEAELNHNRDEWGMPAPSGKRRLPNNEHTQQIAPGNARQPHWYSQTRWRGCRGIFKSLRIRNGARGPHDSRDARRTRIKHIPSRAQSLLKLTNGSLKTAWGFTQCWTCSNANWISNFSIPHCPRMQIAEMQADWIAKCIAATTFKASVPQFFMYYANEHTRALCS